MNLFCGCVVNRFYNNLTIKKYDYNGAFFIDQEAIVM